MKKCFQAKGVCTITAHTPLSATLVWQLSHYLFRETCFMNSYPMGSSFLYQENPAAAESPPSTKRGGTIANGDQGGEENFPGQLR